MPSFDVVSELDTHEVTNAVDQANRVIDTRFDFKGIEAKFTYHEKDNKIDMRGEAEIHLQQMLDILKTKLAARNVDLKHMTVEEPKYQLKKAEQEIKLQQGIDKENAKKIVKLIKNEKFKVQAAINEDKIRVTGKKRDDLQNTIAFLKKADVEVPLQYENFRD